MAQCTSLTGPNTAMDDVVAVIGWSAAVRLVSFFGGSNLYVPGEPDERHPLVALMGWPAFRALCESFGDSTIWIPQSTARPELERRRDIAKALLKGETVQSIADRMGLTPRHVMRVRAELVKTGLLPMLADAEKIEPKIET